MSVQEPPATGRSFSLGSRSNRRATASRKSGKTARRRWAPPRLLRLTGPFHLGHALAQADLELAPQAKATNVALTFRAFGLVDEAMRKGFEGGWRELIEVRLKAFVEEGKRLGTDPGPQGNS